MKRSGMHHLRKSTPLREGGRWHKDDGRSVSFGRAFESHYGEAIANFSQSEAPLSSNSTSPFVFVSLASRCTAGSLFSKQAVMAIRSSWSVDAEIDWRRAGTRIPHGSDWAAGCSPIR